MKNPKTRLTVLKASRFVTSITPVMIAFVVNWAQYVNTMYNGIKLSAGAVIAISVLAIQTFGKIQIKNRVVVLAIIFLLAYLLDVILQDLLLLSGLALFGEVASLGFVPFINKIEQQIENENTENVIAKAIKRASETPTEETKNINLRS